MQLSASSLVRRLIGLKNQPDPTQRHSGPDRVHGAIAIGTLAMIGLHLVLRFVLKFGPGVEDWPLLLCLGFGGSILVWELGVRLVRFEFGSDLLAGIAIVCSVILRQYLAGALVVLMLSGGEALEQYAVRRASSALDALAKRMPHSAHLKCAEGIREVPLEQVSAGDELIIFPHEICPADGEVIDGHGNMDESYLTGEPFPVAKAAGSAVSSGTTNGASALTIRAVRPAKDSRYARIMQVMRASEQNRPKLRRLGDRLGAVYTPVALAVGVLAWVISGSAERFLAVLVVATPCPLLIAIPVAIIGAISLSARRSIIIRNAAVLEHVNDCKSIILDKTGTLTYGEPRLKEELCARGFDRHEVLALTASLERYSKHPLARAILRQAEQEKLPIQQAREIREHPGEGLAGEVNGRKVLITSRKKLPGDAQPGEAPEHTGGPECVVVVDGKYAATYRFHDEPREDSRSFISHLRPKHRIRDILLLSGDRAHEARKIADKVGIEDVLAEHSPEQKLQVVRHKSASCKTLYIGDGINDAPALAAATVGVAMGQHNEVTSEAADVVVMDNSLTRVDEFFHISQRMRRIALQSAVGGMVLSMAGMMLAAAGWLPPVAGAVTQEAIDVLAVLNALRAGLLPAEMVDMDEPE